MEQKIVEKMMKEVMEKLAETNLLEITSTCAESCKVTEFVGELLR